MTHLGVIGVLGFCNSQPAMPISQSVGVPRSELVVLEPLLVPQVVCHDLVEHCGVERIGIAAFVGEALRDVRVAGLVDALGRLRARARLDEAVHADVRVGIVPRPLRQTAKAQAINKNFLCIFRTTAFTYPSAILVHASVVQALPAPAIFLEVVDAFGNASERTGGAGAHAFLIYEELHEEVPVHMA